MYLVLALNREDLAKVVNILLKNHDLNKYIILQALIVI